MDSKRKRSVVSHLITIREFNPRKDSVYDKEKAPIMSTSCHQLALARKRSLVAAGPNTVSKSVALSKHVSRAVFGSA